MQKTFSSNMWSGPRVEWPVVYGFSIYGQGPTYIVSVERDSVAHEAGLCPGDQLVQVDGHDVTEMSAEAIVSLAKHSQSEPPTLGVVSRVQFVELVADRRWGYGMRLKGVRPTLVESVDPTGPASKAGIRPGDIILEIEGHRIRKIELAESILREKYGTITMAMVTIDNVLHLPYPVRDSSPSSMVPVGMTRPRGSRVRKARDLFAKMNVILENNFEKKMALVGLLKQYAEKRNIETFSSAIAILLADPRHRPLIREIRSFIPLKHKTQFDALLDQKSVADGATDHDSSREERQHQWYKDLSEPRTFTIERVDGSFGFVLRGHSPVCIESVLTGGPADRAGLRPGDGIVKLNGIDVRKCSHEYLVKLLQDSGQYPKLEVIQGNQGLPENQDVGNWSSSSASSASSDSSPERMVDWLPDMKGRDSGEQSFRLQVNHLLTGREKIHMRRTLMKFREDRNVSQLVDRMTMILDTDAKQTLWKHLLPRLPEDHQKYILQNAGIPKYLLTELFKTGKTDSLLKTKRHLNQDELLSDSQDSLTESSSHFNSGKLSSSFRRQLGFLLTSRERSQLQKTLQIYEERRNVHHLLEDVMELLDTPSKTVLWHHIIPLLSIQDQKYCHKVIPFIEPPGNLPDPSRHFSDTHQKGSSPATPRRGDVLFEKGFSLEKTKKTTSKQQRRKIFGSSDEDVLPQRRRHFPKSHASQRFGRPTFNDSDSNNESDESDPPVPRWRSLTADHSKRTPTSQPLTTKTGVNSMDRAARQENANNNNVIRVEAKAERNPDFIGGSIDISRPSPSDNSAKSKVKMVRESSAQTTPLHQMVGRRQPVVQQEALVTTSSPGASQLRTSSSGDFRTIVKVGDERPVDSEMVSAYSDRTGSGMPASGASRGILRDSALRGEATITRVSSDKTCRQNSASDVGDGKVSKSVSRSNSFQIQAQNVLKAFDDIVEGELRNSGTFDNGNVGQNSVAPPAPPPPPPPPPVPVKNNPSKNYGFAVKRINWEKLDKVDENTVWAKIGDGEDLEDVVKYLELEQKFSTKRATISESFKDRKTEVSILSPKKAYNISILLAHTKTAVVDIKLALLALDERVLTPELLKQLLAYAPDSGEMEKFDEYRGLLDDLSKADQFIYQISRVPGYLHRLEAMLFKANFAETTQEVKESLRCLKKASQELLESKKMAKILELVLAMGNFMNKGNSRVGEASGFRIGFLSQLDLTKTSNGDSTFLHVLADAVQSRFPDVFHLADELPSIAEASKVSDVLLTEELAELRKVLQDISNTVDKMTNQKQRAGNNDRFHDIMEHFISHASDEVQGLFSLHASAVEEFHRVVQYFGENTKDMTSVEFFSIFGEFLIKFEKAHQRNLMSRKKPVHHDGHVPARPKYPLS